MTQIEGKFTSKLLNKTSMFPDENNENLIKVNLTKNGNTEGIWVQISNEDLEDYKSDKRDGSYTRIAICRNDSLNGVPFGAVFPYKLNGQNRPISIMEQWLDGAVFVVLEKFRPLPG